MKNSANGLVAVPTPTTTSTPTLSAAAAILTPGNSFDENLASAKYFGFFAARRTGNRLEISGGIARLDVKGGLIFGTYDPLGGGGIAKRSIAIPTTGSGEFVEVSYPKLNRTSFALGLKYLLVQAKTEDGVAVAVGAGYNGALADNTHLYLVASKKFSKGARGVKAHLGLRYDRFELQARVTDTIFADGVAQSQSFDTSETSNRASAFIGAEVPLSNTFSVVGELQSKNTKLSSESLSSQHKDAGKKRVFVRFRHLNHFTIIMIMIEMDADRVLNVVNPHQNARFLVVKTGSDTNFVLNAGRTPYSLSLRYYKQNLSGSIGVQRQGILGKAGVFAQLGYGF